MAINRVSPRIGKVVDIPGNAPTIGTATDLAGDGKVSVAFTAPSTATGGPIFSYTAVSNPGSITGTGTTSPITVSGLTNDTSYTFQVSATNPTGNGPLSSASNSATPTAPPNAFESIATVEVGSGGVSSVTFSSIPTDYAHLQLRLFLKADSTGRGSITINSGSYARLHQLYGDGSSAASASTTNNWILDFSATANIFAPNIVDILDYQNTNKTKTYRNLYGIDYNGSGSVGMISALDLSTTAINSITLAPSTGNWSQYSHFALYGIKGA